MDARISRRNLIAGGIGLAGAGRLSAAVPGPRKLKVVVAGGHPGDPEYGCGGTIARYRERGDDVALLYLNRGERGFPAGKPLGEAGDLREAEARKACALLNARPLFAGQIDGEAVVNAERCLAFRKILEAERPDVILTQWPIDNHPDHRAISMLVYDAWSRLGKTAGLYFYEVSNGEDTLMFSPTHYVDISKMEALKRAACFAHASQAPEKFYSLQDHVARFRGIESGSARAEAYVRHIQSPDGLLPR